MPHFGHHAVVIGASMAGLSAARVLADRFERVTVLDRDALPQDCRFRKGVPQGRHAHGLLARGREVLEALFPGLTAALVAEGALTVDLLADSTWFNHGVYLRSEPSGLMGLLVSRPRLEHYVRRRLGALANVRLLERCEVLGPVLDFRLGRVTGVEIDCDDRRQMLAADLVVDASGRGSQSRRWLEAIGFEPPTEETVDVGLTYTTRIYRRRPRDARGKSVFAMRAGPPLYRFGVALAQENDTWIVGVGGYFGDGAPHDEEGFRAFVRSLPVPEIGDLVSSAEPLSPFRGFRFPASVRRRYERLRLFPNGYLVMGDALCSFNPAYGQGMTAAVLEAELLGDCLDQGQEGLAKRFFAAAAELLDIPWRIAVGGDLENPKVAAERTWTTRFLGWYIAKLHHAGARDATLATRFLEVANLMAPPTALLRPGTALRVLWGNLQGGSAPEASNADDVWKDGCLGKAAPPLSSARGS